MFRIRVLSSTLAVLFVQTVALAAEPALELVIQTGHPRRVTCVAVSADGKWLLTGSEDGSAILWDAATGLKAQSFHGHAQELKGVALSNDGRKVVTASADFTATLWDAATGSKLHLLNGHQGFTVNCAAFNADGSRALTGGNDNTVVLWDTATGRALRRYEKQVGGVQSVAFSRDGRQVAAGGSVAPVPFDFSFDTPLVPRPPAPKPAGPSDDNTAIVWDAATGRKLQTLRGHKFAVWQVAFSADGRQLVTRSQDATAKVWDVRTGQALKTFPDVLAISLDGSKVLTGPHDKPLSVWDSFAGRKLSTCAPLNDDNVRFAVTNDGKRFVGFSPYVMQPTTLRDAVTGQILQTFYGRVSPVRSLALSGDGNTLALGDAGRTATVWDLSLGRRVHALSGHESGVMALGLSEDGGRLLSVAFGGPSFFWDARTGSRLQQFPAAENSHLAAALSGDGKIAAVTSYDRITIAWNAESGRELRRFPEGIPVVSGLALTRDGKRLLSVASDWSNLLRAIDTGETVRSYRGVNGAQDHVALSADETRIAVASRFADRIALWDAATGDELQTMKANDVSALAITQSGEKILTGLDDGSALLWDGRTGQLLSTLNKHRLPVTGAALTGDGKLAFTASEDGTAWMWDATTGRELCCLLSLDAGKEWLAVTPEGLFDGSIGAPQYVSYRLRGTLEFVPLDRYQQKFYQPGLLAMLIQGARPAPKVDIAKSLPPKVRITAPTAAGANLSSSQLTVQAVAETRGEHPIKTFRLLVNGRPYRGQMGVFPVANPKAGTATASWSIDLEPGRHTLKVLADTEYVQGASDEIEVRYLGGGGSPVELPTLYVLAIGISKYSGTRKLDYAALDAQAVAQAFQERSTPLFKTIETKTVLDEEADRKGFFAGIQWLRERMTQKSVGVVFFAGHGEKDQDGILYFLPVDFEEKNLAGSAIDADVLKRQLMGIPGRLTLMLDACHSGEIGAGKTRGVGGLTDQLVRDLTAEESGLIVMCSALGHESAQESHAHRHGLFAAALLEGLSGQASKSPDGAVYLTALDAYVAARVKELSKGQQNPVTGKPTTVRDFPMSKP